MQAILALTVLAARATASYAPNIITCPADVVLVRNSRDISDQELDWVHGRKVVASEHFVQYLRRANLTDFDVDTYESALHASPDQNMPILAMANSGGGWRSAFTGIGALKAFDSLSPGSNETGTGGLLQSLTYYAGLSGGSWPVSSLALHNYPAVSDMVLDWHVDINRANATNDTEYAATVETMFEQVAPKFAEGFNLTVTDVLGRVFAYQFVPGADGGLETTFSSIQNLSNFKSFSGPMPLLQANSIEAGVSPSFYGIYVPLNNSTIYTWTPFDFGSSETGFTPTQYVGSRLAADGSAAECVEGYDRASFVMSSVASAWNFWWLSAISNNTLGSFSKRDAQPQPRGRYNRSVRNSKPSTQSFSKRAASFDIGILESINQAFNTTFNLSVSQISNPSIPVTFEATDGSQNVTLADGSEALQSIPFWSLIAPNRKTDLIIAWDDDGDDDPYGWNNGTNMWSTSMFAQQANIPFPLAPTPSTMLANNFTQRPTFFGCDANLTTTKSVDSPIVLYMANSPYSWYSNYSWNAGAYSYEEFDGVLVNSGNIVTQGNGTLDVEWTACIACAAVERSLARVGMERTAQCERCFEKYCWNGQEALESAWTSESVFDPSLKLDPGVGFDEWVKTHPFTG